MKQLLLALLAILVIAAVVVAVRTVGARDETSTVERDEAAAIAQGGKDDAQDAGSSDPLDAGLRPAPGTYTYEGSGRESVTALGGSAHTFPDQVPMVVTLDGGDDCAWAATMIYVEEHVEKRSFCTTAEGLLDHGFRREIEFFNQLQETEFECRDDAMRMRADAAAGDTWSWTCTQGEDARSRYTATVVGTERLQVGSRRVEAVRMRVESRQTGATRGRDRSEFWFDATGLPLRFTTDLDVTTDSVLGETRFRERTSYALTSLVPVVE